MRKLAKLSLVAAVAVAGMTNLQAASLEESIKGVEVSGKVRYRMEHLNSTGPAAAQSGQEDQDFNIDVKVKVPVNENVSFISNLNIDNDNQEGAYTNAGGTSIDFTTPDDNSKTFNLSEYYFQYTNGGLTALLGTQEIPGRLTDGETGSGLVALYNFGNFTVGAASMYNNNIAATNSEMINSVIAMGTLGPVSLLGQYVDIDQVATGYNLKADASVGPAMVGVEYSEVEHDTKLTGYVAATKDDRSTLKAYASAKVGIVSGKFTYAKTGDNGSGQLDASTETPSEYLLWQLGTSGMADMDLYAIDASVAVTPTISLRAAYADAEVGNVDHSELLGQVSYKMSKNLNTYVRASSYDNGVAATDDSERVRLEVQYTF